MYQAHLHRREDYLIAGKSGLETAVTLSTEIPKAWGKVPKDYDMLGKLVHVVKLFQENKIRFALIGGLALSEHALPRATKDVDFLVEDEDMEKARGLLENYYKEGNAEFMLFDVDGVRMDLVAARLRLHKQGITDAQLGKIEGVEVPVVSARDLLLLKLIAAGDRQNPRAALQDQADAASILEHSRGLRSQDVQYVADRILEAFCYTQERLLKYRALLAWLNEVLEKLGRPEWKARI